jgi:dehydrogenase/reductase SDR family protein 12
MTPINIRTGYIKHVKSYYNEVAQAKAALKPGEEGADTVDLKGKVVVITGANSGVGKEVASYVVCKGARLYMLCRSAERAATARREIMAAAGLTDDGPDEQRVQVVTVDVAELAQVRAAAQQLQAAEPHIHCLVCNAGVLLNEQKNSSEGLESTFASHLLGGTYLLASLLRPQLEAAEDSRVVVVTSGGMYNCGLPSWDVMTSYTCHPQQEKPEHFKFDGNLVYAYAKRGQVVLLDEWSRQQKHAGGGGGNNNNHKVPFVTVHPGWTDTPAVDAAYGDQKKWLAPMRTPWQGAEGVAWLTATPAQNLESGALYLDRQVQKKHMAGPFMTEGSFTKNSPEEIQAFIENLKKAAGL